MTKPEFVHLHLHSEYSLLDGACRFNKLAKRAQELGMPAIALTDHGNLFGAVGFYKACKDAGVKPIIGCELYVAGGSRLDKQVNPNGRRNYYHLLLLADSHEGYLNLAKLSSIGYTEGFYYKPRVDHETLAKYSGGLVATSGCLAGEIPQALLYEEEAEARKALDFYLQVFGRDRFYFEIQNHGIEEQAKIIPGLVRFSKEFEIPLVATNDCHYVERRDSAFHDVLLCIQTGKTQGDKKRFEFQGDAFYVKTAEEMTALFSELPSSCRSTLEIAERCSPEIRFKQSLLPKFKPPDGSSDDDYLRAKTYEGLHARYGTPSETHIERVETELACIKRMQFSSYFLVVWDFIHYAKVNGIPVGPGRGSAAGSLVAFCLGITDIDPIEHGLIFERFLNPERKSMPDIDIDFCFENRGKVIEYVKRKYGEKNVAQIITFGTLKPKNAVRDVGRALNVPLNKVDEIAKLIPAMLKAEKGKTAIDTAMETTPELKTKYDDDPDARKIIDFARDLEGTVRHASTHAAGVVICDHDITDFVPVYKPADSSDIATQFTMTTVEEIGLLKMDFLGLKNLTIIENTLKSIRKNYGVEIDWSKIPLDEPVTYELLRDGKTFGVFQLESSGMTSLVKKLAPTTFADLTALLALYRPGPLGSGMVDDYVERKHGRKEVRYDHPMLEPILRETYGIILYQEQVMNIARVLAGYSMGGADEMRRAMGKKKAEEMAKHRQRFIEGSAKNDIPDAVAGHIFDQIDYFAGYGFNKSHSAAYAVISFRTAYLKAHYPVDYMAALMTNAIGGKVEEMVAFFNEAREQGIGILPPDVNESDKQFTVRGHDIRFGLAAVKNVGESAVESIIAARAEGGPFKNFDEFFARIDFAQVNARMVECLIKVGAFDSLGARRSQLLEALPMVIEVAQARHKEKLSGQGSLFDVFDSGGQTPAAGEPAATVPLKDIPEIPDREKLELEKELIGYYVSGHPLDMYEYDMASFATHRIRELAALKNDTEVRIVGMVSRVTVKLDRSNNQMAFVEITDPEAATEVLVFSRTYERYRPIIASEQVLVIRGKLSVRDGIAKVLADEIRAVEEYREKNTSEVEITVGIEAARDNVMERLTHVFRSNSGRRPVQLVITDPQTGALRVSLNKTMPVKLTNEFVKALSKTSGVRRVRFLQE